MPICSIGILTLRTVLVKEEILEGKSLRRKLRHRPRLRSGIGMLVRVITGPHHRSRLDMAETEAQRLVPQIHKFFRLIKARDRQMIF